MGILDNCTDLWYLMSDFFYKHKCTNGFIDPNDRNYYSFRKKGYLFMIRRLNNHNYELRITKSLNNVDIRYYQLKSLEEVQNKILQYF